MVSLINKPQVAAIRIFNIVTNISMHGVMMQKYGSKTKTKTTDTKSEL